VRPKKTKSSANVKWTNWCEPFCFSKNKSTIFISNTNSKYNIVVMRRKGNVNVTLDSHHCMFSPLIVISLNLIQTCMKLNITSSLQMVYQHFSSSNHKLLCNESVFPILCFPYFQMLDMIAEKCDGSFSENWCRSWRTTSAAADTGCSSRNSSRKTTFLPDAAAVGQVMITCKLSSNASTQITIGWENNRVGWHRLHIRHRNF